MAIDQIDRTDAPAPRRRRRLARLAVLLVLPAMLATACKPGKVIEDGFNDTVDTIADAFGLGENEIATPAFEITNGITIQVVIKATDAQGGLPVVVHVRCAGGTGATQTVVLEDSGSISLGDTTFEQGWQLGADCVVSQETVQNVEIVKATVTWLSDTLVQANFLNA